MKLAESHAGEPRNLEEWLRLEEERVLALLGREVVRLHGHLDTRAHELMAVVAAIQFVRDAPLRPETTLDEVAARLREHVRELEARHNARLSFSETLWSALSDARVFLRNVERILNWLETG